MIPSAPRLDQIRFVAMMGTEVKVAFLHEMVTNAAHDHGVIAITQLGHQHSHGKRPLLTQGSRKQAGLVVEFSRSGANAVARFVRDGSAGNVVRDKRRGRVASDNDSDVTGA